MPLSDRITYNSRTNSEPVAFLDDTLEPAISTCAAANTLGTTAIQSVNVSREWFIYRKSGSASGATSATNDTLYYDTRRLTAVVAGLNATTSFATTTSTVTNGTRYH